MYASKWTIADSFRPCPSMVYVMLELTPHTSFAISRNLNFCIFPVLVFGSSTNTTWRGLAV